MVYGLMQLVTRFLEVFAPNEVETRFLHPRNMNLFLGTFVGTSKPPFPTRTHTPPPPPLVQFMAFDKDSIYGND